DKDGAGDPVQALGGVLDEEPFQVRIQSPPQQGQNYRQQQRVYEAQLQPNRHAPHRVSQGMSLSRQANSADPPGPRLNQVHNGGSLRSQVSGVGDRGRRQSRSPIPDPRPY